ncbi:MAG TPA: DUF2142 domain-containing protein [Chromatiaceae bacterium]|nr:DUF2142 domain-containing protein [Chromatiaceae bacterium]
MSASSALSSIESRWLLLLSVGVYLFLAVLYMFAIPPGESPDEPGHMVCVEQVARFHRLPLREPVPEGDTWWSRGRIIAGHMCYHMPLYYLAAGSLLEGTARLTNTPKHFEFPPSNPDGPQPNMFQHENKPLLSAIPEPVTMIVLRLFSIALGLVAVPGAYILSRRLYPDEQIVGALAALLTAGWVQFVALSQGINNDVLATALAIITLLVLVQTGRPRRFVVAAFIASLAVLTKITMLFTIGAVLSVWIAEVMYLKPAKRPHFKALLLSLLIWSGTFLLISQHPVLRENLRISTGAFTAVTDSVITWDYWQQVFQLTLSSGWARLGWMSLPAPMWHAYLWWSAIAVFSVLGLRRSWHSPQKDGKLLVAILLIWLAGILFTYLRINLNRLQPQFRFAFASLPVLTTWTAGGIAGLIPRQRQTQWAVLAAITIFLLGYNIWFVTAVIGPAYGWRLY